MNTFCFVLFSLLSCAPTLNASDELQKVSFERFLAELNGKNVTYKNVKKLPAQEEYALTKQNTSCVKGGTLANTTKSNARHTALPIPHSLAITLATDDELKTLQTIDWKNTTPADIFNSQNHVFMELRSFISESASFLSAEKIDNLPAFEDGFTEASRYVQCSRTVNFKSAQDQEFARAIITCQRYETVQPAPKNGFNIQVDIQGLSSKKSTWTEPMFKKMLGVQDSFKTTSPMTMKDYFVLSGILLGALFVGALMESGIDSIKSR